MMSLLLLLVVVAAATVARVAAVGIRTTWLNSPLNIKCLSCSYVADNTYFQTTADGSVAVSFPCTSSAVAGQFCGDPATRVIQSFTPDPTSVCTDKQHPITCPSEEYVTVWGEGNSDPNYLTLDSPSAAQLAGTVRDWTPADYDTVTNRVPHLPATPRTNAVYGPDVYAYEGGGIFSTLMKKSTYVMPNPGGSISTRTLRTVPPFKNYNSKLFFFQGSNDYNVLDTYREQPMEAFYRALFAYLTTHPHVETVERPVGNISFVTRFHQYTATDITNFRNTFNLYYCPGAVCDQALLGMGARVTGAAKDPARPTFNYDIATNLDSGGAGLYFYTMDPIIGAVHGGDVLFPNYPQAADSCVLISAEIPYTYPFILFPSNSRATIREQGGLQFAEQSIDGVRWTAVPETLSAAAFDAHRLADWAGVLRLSKQAHVCNKAPDFNCFIPIGVTGMNKFMRIVMIGSSANPSTIGSASFTLATMMVPPMALFSTSTPELVSLTVMPTTRVSPHGVDPGVSVCTQIDACDFILPPWGYTYPSSPTTTVGLLNSGGGSLIVRDFINKKVMPKLFDCKQSIEDPVATFLRAPTTLTVGTKCYRFRDTPLMSTCYTYMVTNVWISDDIIVYTDSLRSRVTYRQGWNTIEVYTVDSLGDYVVPKQMIGPFTPTNRTPSLYVYDVAVPNSLLYNGLYFSTTSECVAGAHLGSMTEDPTCTCRGLALTPTSCMCADNRHYKVTGVVPAGVTFLYPGVFSAVAVPTSFQVQEVSLSFDTALFTSTNLNCELFLCSNSQTCLETLVESAYIEFCLNLNRILKVTLSNLAGSTEKVTFATDEFMKKNGLPTGTDLTQIPPIANSLPSGGSTSGLAESAISSSVRQYATKVTATQLVSGKVIIEGPYNFAGSALTTIGSAVGISIIPAVGVGILTEKVNTLALQQAEMAVHINAIAGAVQTLATQVNIGLSAVYDIAVKQASAHNALVADLNRLSDAQNGINGQFASAINSINRRLSAAEYRVKLLDLISARASTLVSQAASIMVMAADHAARGREFAIRVAACTDPGTQTGSLCSGTTGDIITTILKTSGSVKIINSLILKPKTSEYLYGTAEFCFGGKHYLALKNYVFYIKNAEILASPRSFFSPRNISESNSAVLQVCGDPDLTVINYTPVVTPVAIVSIAKPPPPVTVPPLVVAPLPTSSAFVNITAELEIIHAAIAAISAISLPPPIVIGPGTGVTSATTDTFVALILGVIGMILGTASFLWLLANACCFNKVTVAKSLYNAF